MIGADIFLGFILGVAADQLIWYSVLSEKIDTLKCSRPKVLTEGTAQWEPGELERKLPAFEEVCRRNYSEKHCPSVVTKAGEERYKLICAKRE